LLKRVSARSNSSLQSHIASGIPPNVAAARTVV
jgi:hypothetical protein